MTTSRKHPSAALWATVVVAAVLVGYPLSMGPACWITSRVNAGARLLPVIYAPIISAYWRTGDESAFGRAFMWYSTIGAAEGWGWFVVLTDSDVDLVWCSHKSYFAVPPRCLPSNDPTHGPRSVAALQGREWRRL